MCVTWCHRQKCLFFNHTSCSPRDCEFAGEDNGDCRTCQNRNGAICGLTGEPILPAGGCCHWGVRRMADRQKITFDALEMLYIGTNETIFDVLTGFEVPFEVNPDGEVWINLADLPGLPLVYGVGTE